MSQFEGNGGKHAKNKRQKMKKSYKKNVLTVTYTFFENLDKQEKYRKKVVDSLLWAAYLHLHFDEKSMLIYIFYTHSLEGTFSRRMR